MVGVPGKPNGYDPYAGWDLTSRPAMFPFLAEYTNQATGEKAGGLAVPSMITEPVNALMRLIGTPNNPGTFAYGPDVGILSDNPERSQYPAQQDMRTLLETFTGGNATRGLGAGEVAARALSDTTPSLPGAVIAGVEGNAPLRGYRGFGGRQEGEPLHYSNADMMFASSDPHVASSYANAAYDGNPVLSHWGVTSQGAVAPLEMNFSNPMRVDAGGNIWDRIPFEGKTWATTDEIAKAARDRGHDGLVIDNIRDSIGTTKGYLPPATTYVALKRGTVTSPLTGETLFSDQLPSLWGSALQGVQDQQPYPNSLFTY